MRVYRGNEKRGRGGGEEEEGSRRRVFRRRKGAGQGV